MLKKKVSLGIALLMTFIGIALSSAGFYIFLNKQDTEVASVETPSQTCPPAVKRLGGYQYIRPLLFADRPCQSERLQPVKNQVETLINKFKQTGAINSASVYLRELNQGEYFSIGEPEKYNPGSLLKVPELITFFKMNETRPGLLDSKVTYSTALNLPKKALYVSKSIEVGKTYSIRELLYYMIAYSDNNATWLLNQRMDMDVFKKVFTDMGLAEPNMKSHDVPISAQEYSYFMRVLYNASYLNIQDSEFCTELLSHSDFASGLIKDLPKDLKVAHKFGEAGDSTGNAHFSESGIIYLHNSPYLITIMTKGKDTRLLPEVVSDISKTVYQLINAI